MRLSRDHCSDYKKIAVHGGLIQPKMSGSRFRVQGLKVDEDQSMQYRPMAYSNIFNQVIIQSIFNIISIVLEHNFEDSSFGYRYNVENLQDEDIFYNWKEYYPKFKSKALGELKDPSNTHYVCCDIKGYYDHIDHAILIQQLRQYITAKL